MKTTVPSNHSALIYKQLNLLNYIAASSLYLQSNFWLEKPLTHDHIKPRILGHWGTVPGLSLIYACANSLIQSTNQKSIFVTGPGHGAPAILANLLIESSLHEHYPQYTPDRAGAQTLIKSFSWPKLLPSHTYPGLPGSIHEGGELGYSLGTAFGIAFDQPDNMAIVVVGDGEAETGALAASWHSNKFYNPKNDGFVLPILHLNGYKISNPTLFATMSDEELTKYFEGLCYVPIIVDQYNTKDIVQDTLDGMYKAYDILVKNRADWKEGDKVHIPIVLLRTMKGWTGPKYNGKIKIEDNNYSHGIPLKKPKTEDSELKILEEWLSSYKPEEFFEKDGTFKKELLSTLPPKALCMGMNPHAQVKEPKALKLPDLATLDDEFKVAGTMMDSELASFSRYVEVMLKDKENLHNFRIFSPDESESNFLEKIFESTEKIYQWPVREWDKDITNHGHFMEILSEQTLMSWMQGYILSGRHGVLVSYEAFLSIIASQIDQYIKFIRQSKDFAWRANVPSLNFIATSSVWRQDHNGFTHQNPILINTLLAKHVDFVNVFFPCDVNTMLVSMEKCFSSLSTVNLIISGKTLMPEWLSLEQARKQLKDGLCIWDFASNSNNPDVVISSAGDYPTMECMAGISIIKKLCPELKFRYVNVTTLSCQGFGCGTDVCMTDKELCEIYTKDEPIIFSFHGYPELMKQMLYDTCLAGRTTLLGYIEKGTTTTPFDMQIKNLCSRYHIAILMLEKASSKNKAVASKKDKLIAQLNAIIEKHKKYIGDVGDDMEEVKNWKWE